MILHRKIVLASSSPFRRELLARLQLPFAVAAPHIDEAAHIGEAAAATAQRLADAKAAAILPAFADALIIGSDQIAEIDGEHIGKPGSHAAAIEQLRRMRGRTVVFHTALVLLDARSATSQSRVIATNVRFREVSDAQIETYLEREQPYNCAGSAKSEGLGIALIAAIEGPDPNALIGLPLIALIDMLKNAGVEVL